MLASCQPQEGGEALSKGEAQRLASRDRHSIPILPDIENTGDEHRKRLQYKTYVSEIKSEDWNVSKRVFTFYFLETSFKPVQCKTSGRHTFSFSEEKAQME